MSMGATGQCRLEVRHIGGQAQSEGGVSRERVE